MPQPFFIELKWGIKLWMNSVVSLYYRELFFGMPHLLTNKKRGNMWYFRIASCLFLSIYVLVVAPFVPHVGYWVGCRSRQFSVGSCL